MFLITVRTFPIPIRRYARADMTTEAIYTFKWRIMVVSLIQLPLQLCSVCSPGRGTLMRLRLFLRFKPDTVIYTTLIHAWCMAYNISKAQRVFEEMKEEGIQPMFIPLVFSLNASVEIIN